MEALTQAYALAQEWLFALVVQPVLFHAGMGNLLEDGYVATGWLLVGVIELALIVTVMLPLQRLLPVEPVTDRTAVRVDILYTLIHRLGLFRVGMFLCAGSAAVDGLWLAPGARHWWRAARCAVARRERSRRAQPAAVPGGV